MGTVIRAEISKKKNYWISKHRYYELKHFCLQYKEFKEELEGLTTVPGSFIDISSLSGFDGDRTGNMAVRRAYLTSKIDLIEKTAKETDPTIAKWLLRGVTDGYSYEYLRGVLGMPCGRDYYYERYRKFYYLLSQKIQPLL